MKKSKSLCDEIEILSNHHQAKISPFDVEFSKVKFFLFFLVKHCFKAPKKNKIRLIRKKHFF